MTTSGHIQKTRPSGRVRDLVVVVVTPRYNRTVRGKGQTVILATGYIQKTRPCRRVRDQVVVVRTPRFNRTVRVKGHAVKKTSVHVHETGPRGRVRDLPVVVPTPRYNLIGRCRNRAGSQQHHTECAEHRLSEHWSSLLFGLHLQETFRIFRRATKPNTPTPVAEKIMLIGSGTGTDVPDTLISALSSSASHVEDQLHRR